MPQLKVNNFTAKDYWNIPDGERAELIDGQLIAKAPPSFKHQKLVSELHYAIKSYINSKNGACEVIPSPFAVYLTVNDDTYVEPDISVICDPNKLSDRGCEGAPDFIVEVVSPSSRKHDYSIKNDIYINAGVREYWIVDPEKERTTVYRYEEDAAPTIFSFDQSITVGIYGDLRVTISELLD